ncbi:MAG: alpha-L-arabinofuranosidase C-terminal domain-containing protein [Dictyoglomaceae bacterium]
MRLIKYLVIVLIFLFITSQAESQHILIIDTSELGPTIPRTLYGIFFEDINYAVDGGLYAELIRNRSFEHTNKLEGWNIQVLNDSNVKVYMDNQNPLNENNLNYLKLETRSNKSEIIITNDGYGGISLKKGEKYILSYYIKGEPEFEGTIKIELRDKKGKSYSKTHVITQKFINEWKKISTELSVEEDVLDAQLVINVKGIGNLCLDMISLFPEKTWNGMRVDLVKMLEDLKPGFVRFPGGCLVEGDSLRNAYRWKDTIGRIEERKTNRNLWGYHQSYGIGFYEYLLLCEHLSAEPVPIFNAGISCQVRGAEYCPIEQIKDWIQDVLDFIEFANGSINTYWGSIRASLGHPEPFNVKYIGIGNENWGEEYHIRFQLFWKAIKEKYPEIKIVFSGPPSYEGSSFRQAWNFAREIGVDIFDEHIYTTPEWFLANSDRYTKYPREGPKVMVGEYAAHTVGRKNNLQSALAEAAFMTGLERNPDLVIMASYAPLFNRINWSQWVPDLIWFDGVRAFGTPSYYAQKIFSENRGDNLLKSSLSDEQLLLIGYRFKSLYHVCSFDSNKKEIIIKVVNPWAEDRSVKIEIKGKRTLKGEGRIIELSSKNPLDENYFDNLKVFPKEGELKDLKNPFVYTFKAFSITIMRLKVLDP